MSIIQTNVKHYDFKTNKNKWRHLVNVSSRSAQTTWILIILETFPIPFSLEQYSIVKYVNSSIDGVH